MSPWLDLALQVRRLREIDLSPQLALAEALAEALASDSEPTRLAWLSLARDRLDRCHDARGRTRAKMDEVENILESALIRAREKLRDVGAGK